MSESENDDWYDGLTPAEYADLRRITTPKERRDILVCAKKEVDIDCDNKIKSILRTMKGRGVDLGLIVKYAYTNLEDRPHQEKIADFVEEIKAESAGGMKRKRNKKTRRRTHKKTRRTHKKTRRSH